MRAGGIGIPYSTSCPDLVDVDGRTAYRADAGRGAEPPRTARLPGYGAMVVRDSGGRGADFRVIFR